MDRNRMIRNGSKGSGHRRVYHAVLGVTLASALLFSETGKQIPFPVTEVMAASKEIKNSKVVYLDGTLEKSGNGTSKSNAVNSFEKAKELAGEDGIILVCGTVMVSEETSLTIPAGIQVKKADGFTGSILAVAGKGKVTLTSAWINASDVDTTKAQLGKEAFVVDLDSNKNTEESKDKGKTEKNKTENSEVKTEKEETDSTQEKTEETGKEETNKEETANEESKKEESDKEESKPDKQPAKEIVLPASVTMKEPAALQTIVFSDGFEGDGTFCFAEPEKVPDTYESVQQMIFIPNDCENYDYSQMEGWNAEKKEVVRSVTVYVESLKKAEETKEEAKENTKPEDPAEEKTEEIKEEAENVEDIDTKEEASEEKKEEQPVQKDEIEEQEVSHTAEDTEETGKQNQETESERVGSLEDSATGIKVCADFLPSYVELRVTKNENLDKLPETDTDIEAILNSFNIQLWDLQADMEYLIPEGKKITVMIPVPENAKLYDSIIIAHYIEEMGRYEYFIPGQNLNIIDGYLVFETASFSPFNVGGNQLVGIGTKSPNHTPAVKKPQSTQTTSGSGSISAASTSTGNKGNATTSGSNYSVVKRPVTSASGTSVTGSHKIVSNAKTGDDAQILLFGAAACTAGLMIVIIAIDKKRNKMRKK